MKKWIFQPLVLAALSASVLFAQTTTTPTPPTPAQIAANLVTQLTTLLDLTSAQQVLATTIFTTEQTTLATVRTSQQTAQTTLQTAILADDTATIASTAATLGGLSTQQVTATATAEASFYASLTSDQQTKFTTLKLSGFFGPGGGGPGGPGPGPGPGGPPHP